MNYLADLKLAIDEISRSLLSIVVVVHESVTSALDQAVLSCNFEAHYEDFIAQIPDDNNKKLTLELAFLGALDLLEERSDLHDAKLDLYCVFVDFSTYLINDKQDPQMDLSFILVTRIIANNPVATVVRFWRYLETRQRQLIRFVTTAEGQKFGEHGRLIGRRRPGSLLLQTANQLLPRLGDCPELAGRVQIYLLKNFNLSDNLYLDLSFGFNQVVPTVPAKEKKLDDQVHKYWTVQQWLNSPLVSTTAAREDFVLKAQLVLLDDCVDALKRTATPDALGSTPNLISDDLKNFVENGDVAFVQSFYSKLAYEFKVDQYSRLHNYSRLNPLMHKELYDVQKHDPSFRLQTVLQIYIVSNFMFSLLDKYKRENYQQLTRYYDYFNRDKLLGALPSLGSFKNIYLTLKDYNGIDFDYYLKIKKLVVNFFSDYNKSLFYICNLLIGQNEMVWLFWKWTKFSMFSFFERTTETRPPSYLQANEPVFGIKFGNRNLTKILTADSRLTGNARQFALDQPETEGVNKWKKARYFRSRGQWLSDRVGKVKKPVDKLGSMQKTLQRLQLENAALRLANEKYTLYVSIAKEQDDPKDASVAALEY